VAARPVAERSQHSAGEALTVPTDVATSFRIFLNYRREDAAGHAGRLWDALSEGIEDQPGFDESQIFMDIDTIEPGVDFREAIRKAVEASDVFLTVIGRHWLTATDSKGRRRLDNPADFVRVEIESALQRAAQHHDVRVVPTRVQGADMPSVEELPDGLADLAHRNAIELTDERWRYDVGRLLASLKKLEREKLERARAQREAEALDSVPRKGEAVELAEPSERATSEQTRRERARAASVADVSPPEPAERPRPALERPLREEGVQEGRRREEERRRRLRKPGAIGAGILAAVVAGAIVLILSLTGGEEAPEATTPPPKGETATVPTPPREGKLDWRPARGSEFGGPGDQVITSIEDTNQEGLAYIAGGYVRSSETLDGALWTGDGGAWQRAQTGAAFEGVGDQQVNSVTEFGGALVAAGMNSAAGDPDAALWRSSDGAHWESIEGLAVPGTDESINRVTPIRSVGMVAAGSKTSGGDDGEDGAVWIFPETLGPVAPVSDADFGGPGDQRISRVVPLETEHGTRLVALGFADGDAGVWISDDGQSWDPVHDAALGGDGTQEILDATPFESGVLAVGTEVVDGEQRGMVWLSEDGSSWKRASDPDGVLAAPSPVSLNRVLDLGKLRAEGFPAFIVGGSAGGVAAAWTSNDGDEWAREADSRGGLGRPGEIKSLRAARRSVIAVGSVGPASDADALVLTGVRPD
jgi:TIR domain-containing protein